MPIQPDIPKAEAAIIEQTNVFRTSNSLAAVLSNVTLTKAARDYARFLASSKVFSHEADGRRPLDRIKAAGYQPCTTAENLALLGHPNGFATEDLASMMVEGWKKSPGHRKNMLLAPVTETGVAIAKSRHEEKWFAVQLFGRPASLQYTFAIENRSTQSVSYTLAEQANTIEPRMVVRHTSCLPADVTFQIKTGGLLTKAVTAKYEARNGAVFRLVPKGSDITVEVGKQQ